MKLLAAALAGLALAAAPAPAAAAPELFVRLQPWDTHEPVSDWIPLATAPAVDYLGGYEIGYRLEASGFQHVALTVAGVPDGRPTQPSNASPYCVGRNGTAGDIVAAGPELQFEGSGTYMVTVSVALGPGSPTDCLAGSSTTASFAVDGRVAPSVVGDPLSFRAVPLAGDPFVGVRAPDPPGGGADVRCALDGTVQPDGSITGAAVVPRTDYAQPSVAEWAFPRPGDWRCVARGTAEGRDDDFETTTFATPWSAPIALDVRSDFRRRTGMISRPRSRRPRFSFKAEWPALANGGSARVTLFRVTGCRGSRHRLRRVATYRGRFDAGRMRITVRRPRAVGYYLGRVSFSGTRFLRRSVDPNPMRLAATRAFLEYVTALPGCPGFRTR